MEHKGDCISSALKQFRTFRYVLILEGIGVGIFSGTVVVLFRILLARANEGLMAVLAYGRAHTWFIPLWFAILAVAAIAASLLLKWEPYISGSGIPQLEGEIQGKIKQNWLKVLIGKFTGAFICLGFGLSLGREGPSIQLGAVTAKGFSRLIKRMRLEEHFLMTCGASAGLSAAFNAPIAGVLFSLEEIHKNFSAEVLLSTMASSITADFISRNIFGLSPAFALTIPPVLPLGVYGHVLIMGLILGLMGVLYNRTLLKSQVLYQKIPQKTLRLMIPFLMAGVFGFLYPMVLGGGHSLVEEVSAGEIVGSALVFLFLLKFFFSMVSFGCGAPGGIFLPLLVLGAVIGGIYHTAAVRFTGVDQAFLVNFVILGMAGYFTAIVRAPITGILLISEMTGSFNSLLPLAAVSLCAYLIPDLAKCPPVYESLLDRILLSGPKGNKEESGEKVLVDGMIYHGALAEGKCVSQIEFPDDGLIVSLKRKETEFIPKGDTRLKAGDRLVILCDENHASKIHEFLMEWCHRVSESRIVK